MYIGKALSYNNNKKHKMVIKNPMKWQCTKIGKQKSIPCIYTHVKQSVHWKSPQL